MKNANNIRWCFLALAVCSMLLVSGCADKVPLTTAAMHEQVGFWYGVWHGLILPFAWIVSLFSHDVAIYAIYNNGTWYDSGYVLGVFVLIVICSS